MDSDARIRNVLAETQANLARIKVNIVTVLEKPTASVVVSHHQNHSSTIVSLSHPRVLSLPRPLTHSLFHPSRAPSLPRFSSLSHDISRSFLPLVAFPFHTLSSLVQSLIPSSSLSFPPSLLILNFFPLIAFILSRAGWYETRRWRRAVSNTAADSRL